MCGICKCFGWLLDIIQRVISCMMAGVMCCAICIGCIIAAGAGIAYGYNLSLAEYINLKKSDVTVYIRRGQFADPPAVPPPGFFARRSAGEKDMSGTSFNVDYQDQKNDDTRPLSDAWQKAQDTRNYANRLTKYSKLKSNVVQTKTNHEDEGLDGFDVNDIPTIRPPYTKSVSLAITSTRQVVKLRKSKSQEDALKVIGLRRNNPIQNKPKKKPDKKTTTIIDYEENSLYLKPNITMFLYSREDFEDKEESEIAQKPL